LIPRFAEDLNHRASSNDSATQTDGFGPEKRASSSTTFFQIPANGQTIVYVLDRSSSMGLHGAWGLAKRELHASLRSLPADARFQVIAYNRASEPLRIEGSSGLLPATPEIVRQAEQMVQSLRAEGGTDHVAALKRALALQPDVLFYLSDADDLTVEQVRTISRFNHGRTMIHAIAFSAYHVPAADAPVSLLARDNRGIARAVIPD
jgi:hypothetical protein